MAIPVLRLISFGFLHLPKTPCGQPVLPAADRIEDVREVLRDPAVARAILDLDGHDLRVQQVVLDTPGARELLDDLTAYVLRSPASPRTLAVGCSGGKHRATALVIVLARELRERGFRSMSSISTRTCREYSERADLVFLVRYSVSWSAADGMSAGVAAGRAPAPSGSCGGEDLSLI